MTLRFYRKNKFIFAFVPFFIVGAYAIHKTSAHQIGEVGQSRAGCGGGGCHGTKSSQTVVSIYTDAHPIVIGQTYIFTISVANADPTEVAAGCDITCNKGSLDTLGDNSGLWQPDSSIGFPDLTHTMPNFFTGDSAVWMFKYTAPKTAGIANIYAAGNAVNGDQLAGPEDHWNTIVHPISVLASDVASSTSSANEITLLPNPSNGTMKLRGATISGLAGITISDAAGRIVLREEIIVGPETPLDFSLLPNGNYFLTVQPKSGQAITERFTIEK